jgi:hypothetical protein
MRCGRGVAAAAVFTVLVALAGCDGDSRDSPVSAEQACGGGSATEVLIERLLPLEPSAAFTVEANSAIHVAVTFDPQFNASDPGLVRSPANLFVIDAAATPDVDESNALGIPGDTRVSMSALDDYRPVDVGAGRYRLYSRGSPEIRVIRCDTAGG